MGGLLAWKGTVTRTTEVRPELSLGTYKCGVCGELARNVQQHFVMTYPSICSAAACGNKKVWKLVKEESSFVDWQRAKVQENADEVSFSQSTVPRLSGSLVCVAHVCHARVVVTVLGGAADATRDPAASHGHHHPQRNGGDGEAW